MQTRLEGLQKSCLVLFLSCLVACGDPGVQPPPPTPGPTLSTQTVGIKVQFPSGVTIPTNGLKLETALGSLPVAADGSTQAEIFEQGPQFAQVLNANDNPVLMGWARPGNVSFTVNTTAQVLMYFDLGSYLSTPDLRAAIMDALSKSTELKPLEDAIALALSTDPNSMGADNPSISAAINAVHAKLLQNPVLQQVKPRSIQINPLAPKSGLEILQGDGQHVKVRNTYRRRAKVFVDRVATIDENGVRQNLVLAARGSATDISPTLTTTSVYGSIADFILAGIPGTDATGKYAWQPVDSDPILMQIVPDTALGSVYSLRAVGAGGSLGEYSDLTDLQKKTQRDLTQKTMIVDFLLPFITGVAMPTAGDLVKTLQDNALAYGVLADAINLVPQAIWDKAFAGDFKGAVKDLIGAFMNPAAYGASNIMKTRMIELAAVLVAKGRAAAVVDRVARMFTDKFGRIIDKIDKVLAVFDASAQVHDVLSSSQSAIWEITVKKGKLRLTPPEQTVSKYGIARVHEKIDSPESYTGLQYQVSTSGKFGHLYKDGVRQTGSFTVNLDLLGVIYVPDIPLPPADAGGKRQDTITIEATGFDGNLKTSIGVGTVVINSEGATLDAAPRSVSGGAGPGQKAVTSFNVISTEGKNSYSVSSAGPFGVVLNGSGKLNSGESRAVRLEAICPDVETQDGSSYTIQGSLTVYGLSESGQNLPPIGVAASLTCGTRKAKSWGDPHLQTFDGRAYNFQATGDFVLTHSLTDQFQVQVRYRSGGGNISYNQAIAAKVGLSVVEVYATASGNPKVLIDHTLLDTSSPVNRDLIGGGAISVNGTQVSIAWADGSNLSLTGGNDWFYNIDLSVPAGRSGQLEGLLGNADGDATNDIRIKGGAVIANPSEKDLYLQYRQSWHVPLTSPASLFSQGPDLYDPFYPVNVVSLEDLDPTAIANAQQICLERGVLDPELFKLCVFDVAVSGDPKFADYALGLDPNVLRVLVNPRFAFVPLGQADRTLKLGAVVTGTENRAVTWATTGGTLQTTGNITTLTAPDTQGTYTVTASLTENSSILGTAKVFVAPSSYVVWTGKANTDNWADAKNWTGGVVPNANNTVVIDTINQNVNYSGGDTTIAGLITNSKLTISSGSLHITGSASLTAGLNIAGGNVIADGVVTLAGQNTWSGGNLAGSGKYVNQGELDLIPGNGKFLSSTLENLGTIKVSQTFYPVTNSVLKNVGTLEFINDADIASANGLLNLENTGLILKSAGTDASDLNVNLINTGTLESRVGTLGVFYGTLNSGTYNASADATLKLDGLFSGDITLQGTLVGTPVGTIISTANLNIPNEAHLNFGGTGFNFSVGNIHGTGKLVNDNLMNFVVGNSKFLSTTLDNLGTIKVSNTFYPVTNSVLKNIGTLEFINDADIAQANGILNLENTGTILKSGGTDSSDLNVNLINTGTLESRVGMLSVFYGTLNGGTYNVISGATLKLDGLSSGDITLQGTLVGTPAGTIISTANLNIPNEAHLNFGGTGFNFSSGNIHGAGKLFNNNLMNFAVGAAKFLSTTLENTGTIKVSQDFYPGSAAALLKNAGTLDFVNDSGISQRIGLILKINNSSILLKSGGTGISTIDADVTNTGTITEQSGHFSFPNGVH